MGADVTSKPKNSLWASTQLSAPAMTNERFYSHFQLDHSLARLNSSIAWWQTTPTPSYVAPLTGKNYVPKHAGVEDPISPASGDGRLCRSYRCFASNSGYSVAALSPRAPSDLRPDGMYADLFSAPSFNTVGFW
jgi:hypothetical protein